MEWFDLMDCTNTVWYAGWPLVRNETMKLYMVLLRISLPHSLLRASIIGKKKQW